MEPGEEIVIFLSEFDYQVEVIGNIYERITRKKEMLGKEGLGPEVLDSVGYWLHNLYCAFEDLFKIISGYWENHVKSGGDYHVRLLKRMNFKINGIRPALLSDKSYRVLNDLRGFRHAFRHAYSYGLDEERVRLLLQRMLQAKTHLMEDLQNFRKEIAQQK